MTPRTFLGVRTCQAVLRGEALGMQSCTKLLTSSKQGEWEDFKTKYTYKMDRSLPVA